MMVERRKKKRTSADRHPLAPTARLAARAERRRRARAQSDRDRVTLHLPATLVERMRDAVYWTPGMTLTSLAVEALEEIVGRLEHDRGSAFPKREKEIRVGRPPKIQS